MRPGDECAHETIPDLVGQVICVGLAHDLLDRGETAIIIDVKFPGLPLERHYYQAEERNEPVDHGYER